MFFVKNPSTLKKPWILSKNGDSSPVSIPLEVTKLLKNYHIMAVEFLYHNYRKGVKGSILNEEPDMNFPLQISAFFRALIDSPAIVLVICSRQSTCFWHYHLTNHGDFEVIHVTSKNSKDFYEGNNKKIALLLNVDCLKLCENLTYEFFTIVIEDFDQIAIKRVIKRLDAKFHVGLTCRSFYTDPDQKLQWNMLNWANPGCVGKLNDFYEIDNNNFDHFNDNYRYWWMRLTWQFCESFEKPTNEESELYQRTIADWASTNSLSFTLQQKTRKRKHKDERADITDDIISDSSSKRTVSRKCIKNAKVVDEVISDSCSSEGTIVNEVPIDKYVKLPSMDESPILTSIIKNLEASPGPMSKSTFELPYTQTQSETLPFSFTQTQPNCSKYNEENSVLFSFLEDNDRPSTSRSESEDFIINLMKKPDREEQKKQDINDILKKADAVLQN